MITIRFADTAAERRALGALAGVIPALRAARLDPVTALRTTN